MATSKPKPNASAPRVIFLTGVTRGLGHALATRFCTDGHTVSGCGRNAERIAAMNGTWSAGGRASFHVVDVAQNDQVRDWIGRALEQFGAPDLVINNAAAINPNAPLWEVSAEDFDRVIDVNLKGVANVIRHVTPAMVKHGRGVIVNLSSYWGRSVAADVAPYCATKWGIEGLTQALARDLPSGLAAVPLNPGIIDTEMLRSCFGSGASLYPSPERWAEDAAPFLLSLGPQDNGKPRTVPGH